MSTMQKTSVCAASCKCVFCERCSVKRGEELREKLKIVFAVMGHIQMWTLTVDPKRFHSPKDAWHEVTSNRMVPRLVRELRAGGCMIGKHYVVVLEFHESGWPHWHLVVNAKYIDKQVFQKIWNRIGTGNPSQNFGYVAFSRGRTKGQGGRFENPRHAAAYITKYIIKPPKDGWPEWVLNHSGRVRRFSTSRLIFQELGHMPAKAEKKRTRGTYKKVNTIALRVKNCGNAFRVFQQTGLKAWRYVGDIPHKFEDIADFFGCDQKTLLLPQPGSDAYVDCLFWAWLGQSQLTRCELVEGRLSPVDWHAEPEAWYDQVAEAPPPWASYIATGEITHVE